MVEEMKLNSPDVSRPTISIQHQQQQQQQTRNLYCRKCFTMAGKNIAYKKPVWSVCTEIDRLGKEEIHHLKFLKNCLTVT